MMQQYEDGIQFNTMLNPAFDFSPNSNSFHVRGSLRSYRIQGEVILQGEHMVKRSEIDMHSWNKTETGENTD